MLAPGRVGIKEALNEFLKVACFKVSKGKRYVFSLCFERNGPSYLVLLI